MTCAVAYRPRRRPDRRIPNSEYTLLAVDGRITDEHGTIYTDNAVKWAQAGSITAVLAGDMSAMQRAIQSLLEASKRQGAWKPLKPRQAHMVMCGHKPSKTSEGWDALMYDSQTHSLYSCDSDGAICRIDQRIAAIGEGCDVALGYLSAFKPNGANWTSQSARHRLRRAIACASERNSTVGPTSTVLLVRPDGTVQVRG